MSEPSFSLDDARQTLAALRPILDELVALRADLADQVLEHNAGAEGLVPDIKAGEARLSELIDRVHAAGVQVKGHAPLLLDFPSQLNDREILLCWLEGEPDLAWYHPVETGFPGRRRLEEDDL